MEVNYWICKRKVRHAFPINEEMRPKTNPGTSKSLQTTIRRVVRESLRCVIRYVGILRKCTQTVTGFINGPETSFHFFSLILVDDGINQ